MNVGIISARYARAIFEYAQSCSTADIVYKEMKSLLNNLFCIPELSRALDDPVIPEKVKLKLLNDAAGEDASSTFKTSMKLVLRKKRQKLLLLIAFTYLIFYRQEYNILAGRLTVASLVSEEEGKKFAEILEQKMHKKLELKVTLDRDLLGGFIMEVNNYQLDASASGQLSKISRQLLNEH